MVSAPDRLRWLTGICQDVRGGSLEIRDTNPETKELGMTCIAFYSDDASHMKFCK